MTTLALVLCALALAWAIAAASGTVWLRRRNRVSPSVRSRAPLAWMASPGRAAAAHRRLRRAVQTVHAAGAARPGLGGELRSCIADVERQATAIDDHLVLAARCSPVVRRSLVRGLEGQVRDIEAVSTRIATLLLGERRPAGGDTVRRISERLDALDAANAELAALEATYASPTWDPTRAAGGYG